MIGACDICDRQNVELSFCVFAGIETYSCSEGCDSDEQPKVFGPVLQKARLDKSLSLSQAAAKLQCSKNHLWALEQGTTSNPTITTLANLSHLYGLCLGNLARLAAASAANTIYPKPATATDAQVNAPKPATNSAGA